MKVEHVVSLEPKIQLAPLNVFDIGANKEYFNKGAMQAQLREEIPSKIAALSKETCTHLAIPAYVLEELQEQEPGVLIDLQSKIQEQNIKLLAQPFYGESTKVLSTEHVLEGLAQHQKVLKKTLGQEARVALLNKRVSKSELDKVGCKDSIVQENTKTPTEMQEHLISEIQAFTTHINQTADQELIKEFSLLKNTQLLDSVHEDTACENGFYEQYSTIITILNDMAHKINTVRLSEKGEFVQNIDLQEKPSVLL